jgi:dTDP-4-amino-4,6-dideoxygalactose transaminase
MAMFARHGGLVKGDHQIEGINSRLDGLQAAILSVKLPKLASWIARRQEIAAEYDRLLFGYDAVTRPVTSPGREHVYHLYVIQHENRDNLAQHLLACGIQTVVNYPTALPFLPAYRRFGHRPEQFTSAYYHQSRVLSLPIYPEMSAAQISKVVESVRSYRC